MKWIFHDDDPTSSVTVTEKIDAQGRRVRGLRTSGRPEGAIFEADTTMRLAGLLPALFAEKLERVFVVGYGLGMTVGELASLRSMREVVVAEISPAVIDAAPLFDYGNQGASTQPSVQIENSDAYRALIRSEGKFDAIVSIPSNTWVAGVEMLFSREFLEAVHDRLDARRRLRPVVPHQRLSQPRERSPTRWRWRCTRSPRSSRTSPSGTGAGSSC